MCKNCLDPTAEGSCRKDQETTSKGLEDTIDGGYRYNEEISKLLNDQEIKNEMHTNLDEALKEYGSAKEGGVMSDKGRKIYLGISTPRVTQRLTSPHVDTLLPCNINNDTGERETGKVQNNVLRDEAGQLINQLSCTKLQK